MKEVVNIMKLRLENDKIILADVISPEMAVGTFENITKEAMNDIVENNNFGEEVYVLYSQYRDTLSLYNIKEFLDKLNTLYSVTEYNKFVSRRKTNAMD